MPYQLIYTSAARLLDSPLSGYGVVARSEHMPAALVRMLIELSEYKEPANQGILGPQFSYRVAECQNTLYHIFTCVRPAGADYSKRSCHIAHHLVLRAEEMHALCRGATPPTPAGILLSLELRRYWVHHWQQEPEYLADTTLPPLQESLTTSNFPTWLIFTGSAENATLFQIPPYNQGCLILVPQKTQSRDILRLLHESYTLSPTLGWGIGFSTYGVESDTLESNNRLFAVAGSPLCPRAQRVGFPVLELRPGLRIIPQSSPGPQPIPRSGMVPIPRSGMVPIPRSGMVPISRPAPPPARIQQPAQPTAEPLTLSDLPQPQRYRYAEDRSNDIFERPWRTAKRGLPARPLIYGACALVVLGALAAVVTGGSKEQEQPRSAPAQPKAQSATAPAPKAPVAHRQPVNPKPATAPEAEPNATPAPPEPQEPEPPAPPTPPRETPPPPPEPEEADSSPTHVEEHAPLKTGKTIPTIVGEPLPDELLNILPKKPGEAVRLLYGDYAVHIGEEEDEQFVYKKGKQHYIVKNMAPGYGYVLLHCDKENECSIISSDGNIPQVTLQLEGKRLVGITVQGSKHVAVQLPLPQEQAGKVHRVLLVPQMRIRLHPLATQPEPEKQEKSVSAPVFDKSLLEWKPRPDIHCELNIKEFRNAENERAAKEHKQSWLKAMEQKVELSSAPSLQLPQLLSTGGGEIKITATPTAANIACKMNGKKPELFHVCKPATELCQRFNEYLNHPRGAERSKHAQQTQRGRTMAHALRLAIDISKDSRSPSDATLNSYRELYQNTELGQELRSIYADHIDLTYSGSSVADNPREWMDQARIIKRAFLDKSNRKILMTDMEKHLSSKLAELLLELRRDYEAEGRHIPDHYLQLKEVQASKGQLIWVFELQQES